MPLYPKYKIYVKSICLVNYVNKYFWSL